jgi:hypothetical protein
MLPIPNRQKTIPTATRAIGELPELAAIAGRFIWFISSLASLHQNGCTRYALQPGLPISTSGAGNYFVRDPTVT